MRCKRRMFTVLCFLFMFSVFSYAKDKKMPPVVVNTTPVAGDNAVSPALKEIRIVFSKPMKDKSWSLNQVDKASFPRITGEMKYLKDKKTLVVPVQFEAGKQYIIWLNSQKFANFKDTDGNPAVPYLLSFKTKNN